MPEKLLNACQKKQQGLGLCHLALPPAPSRLPGEGWGLILAVELGLSEDGVFIILLPSSPPHTSQTLSSWNAP